MGAPVTLTDPEGNYVDIGGGGGSSSVAVTNWPATQPVSGTVSVTGVATAANQSTQTTVLNTISTTMNELNTDFGIPSEPAWSGTGNGTVIAILKALHAQNASIIGVLEQIQTNTAGA